MGDRYRNNEEQTPNSPSTPSKVIRFDKSYIKKLPGILKAVVVFSNLLGFICIKVSLSQWISAIFYNILYWIGIIVSGLLLLLYTFHFVEKFHRVPWLKLEMLYCTIMGLTFIGVSIFATTIGEGAGYAVGFFGLCTIIAYGLDAYLKYKDWKNHLPAQH